MRFYTGSVEMLQKLGFKEERDENRKLIRCVYSDDIFQKTNLSIIVEWPDKVISLKEKLTELLMVKLWISFIQF